MDGQSVETQCHSMSQVDSASGEADEPPNRTRTLWLLVMLFSLLGGKSNMGELPSAAASSVTEVSLPTLYLSSFKILKYQYLPKNVSDEDSDEDLPNDSSEAAAVDIYAFLEVELTKSPHLSLHSVRVGLSGSQCSGPLLAQSLLSLNPQQGEEEEVMVLSGLVPSSPLLNRTLDVCLQAEYVTKEGEEVVTPWRLQMGGLNMPLPGELSVEEPRSNEEKSLSRQRREETTGPQVFAMLLEDTSSRKTYTDEGVIIIFENVPFEVHLVGRDLDRVTAIKFTTLNNTYGEKCLGEEAHFQSKQISGLRDGSHPGIRSVLVTDGLNYHSTDRTYYLCVEDQNEDGVFRHQGDAKTLKIEMTKSLLPVWISIVLLGVLLCLSGLFSGLNLGLMSLDQTELKIVMSTGTDQEKAYAKAIMPIRGMGNFLLCSILLGNVLVNNTLTILLDTLTGGGGIVAVIGATLGIVVFGEIIPQAICSRHGLAVGARTIWLTKFFMALTSPLSFPISKVLDMLLGSEIGTVYNKERLMELLKVTDQYNDLEKDEVNIVTGALVLKQKTVKHVMTNLDDCYMLPIDAVLDFETISEIKDQGYSRIPIYEGGERSSIVHILFAKDLLFIDPDDAKPIEEICKFYRNDVNFVYQDTILTDMFDEFKSGEKGHMALVQEVNNEGDGDPFHETVGLVTLEDIIEEIIQQEIIDETDIVLDNKSKKKRKRERYKKDAEFKMFLSGKSHQRVEISPQISLAILQFLTTSVRAFSPENCAQRILQKMLSMDVFRELKLAKKEIGNNNNSSEDKDDKKGLIMVKGKPCDFFIMIIEGRVEVTIGKEERKFTEGPFSCFGEQMLEQALMLPSSPMVSSSQRGTTLSLGSSQDVGARIGHSAPLTNHLKKTDTRLNMSENKRSTSADTALPLPSSGIPPLKQPAWIPDYSLRAVTDLIYLKVRKNTYMVAIKASRMNNMNSDSGGLNMNDQDISDVLAKVIENNDDDEFGNTPSVRSPDKSWDGGGVGYSTAGTPTEFRRESIRSSLSMMKQKFMGGQNGGRSNSSIDKTGQQPKDEFWDVGSTNPALDREGEDISDQTSTFNSGREGSGGTIHQTNGPMSLPLNGNTRQGLQRDVSDPVVTRGVTLPDIEGASQQGRGARPGGGAAVVSGNTTVISVRGSGGGKEGETSAPNGGSPSDRTSLLNTDHPVS